MKSLIFIIIMALHTRDLKAEVTPDDIVINMKDPLSSNSESFVEICRGIVIHPKVVMTAAECVDGLLPTDLQVKNTRRSVSSNVSHIIVHPKYTEVNGSNNFAILIMDQIIIMRNSIACLPNETFLNNTNLKTCSATLITEYLRYRMKMNVSSDESYWALDCKLDDKYKENPHMFRSRQVEMMICKPISENSQCLAYYFAHYSSNKTCSSGNSVNIQVTPLHTSFVYDVTDWVQDEIQKYVNGVPRVSSCILILTTCIITHFSV